MESIQKQPPHAPSSASKWATLFVLVMLPFMATLDSSIINVALPIMADSLQVTSSVIAWVVSSYLIVITASILFFGRLGDMIGHTRVFRMGLLGFTLGSLLCGLSHSFAFLIIARAIQALGASAAMANNQGIITRTFPEEERGRALGINAAFVALGTLVGPSLGGFIISFTSWEYLFWINVPVGIAAFVAGLKLFPKTEATVRGKMDFLGTALFTITIAALFIALGQGQAIGFSHPLILTCFAVTIIAFLLFLFVQKKSEAPLLQLSIFRNKWFSVSVTCGFISFLAISSSNIILPFYLQDLLKFSPGIAGMFMTIYPLILVLVAPISGYLSDKIGSEALTLVGLFLTGAGLLSLSFLGEQPDYVLIGLCVGVMGLGNGLFQSPNNSIVMSSVPREQLGIGGSVNALMRNLGFTTGIALATSLLYGGMSAKLGYRVTDFVEGQNDAFLFGMRIAYITAAAVCFVGVGITAMRLIARQKQKRILN